uniref:Uncharacterized protein n=1 Tax=Magnetococcus massalia (strain MO-1) TaxID=451514 RepID=A0A1S7LG24_MAGMO|nr:conserved protein of unknown function [Candidatus Magnetococcus massalia]
MATRASLKQIADGISIQSEERTSWLDRETGEVLSISEEEFQMAEEEFSFEDPPDWHDEAVEIAKRVMDDGDERYLALPSKWDFHEYKVMEQFCYSRENLDESNDLLDAIRGRGAFRMFKGRIRQLGILDDWYRFRDEVLQELAADWAKENGIELVDE